MPPFSWGWNSINLSFFHTVEKPCIISSEKTPTSIKASGGLQNNHLIFLCIIDKYKAIFFVLAFIKHFIKVI